MYDLQSNKQVYIYWVAIFLQSTIYTIAKEKKYSSSTKSLVLVGGVSSIFLCYLPFSSLPDLIIFPLSLAYSKSSSLPTVLSSIIVLMKKHSSFSSLYSVILFRQFPFFTFLKVVKCTTTTKKSIIEKTLLDYMVYLKNRRDK